MSCGYNTHIASLERRKQSKIYMLQLRPLWLVETYGAITHGRSSNSKDSEDFIMGNCNYDYWASSARVLLWRPHGGLIFFLMKL